MTRKYVSLQNRTGQKTTRIYNGDMNKTTRQFVDRTSELNGKIS